MRKTRKYSRMCELTSVQLWELSFDKNVIVYQAEFTRYREDIGQSMFLVEWERKQ